MKVLYLLQSDNTEVETRDERELPKTGQFVRLKQGTYTVTETDVGFENGQEFFIATVLEGKLTQGPQVV